MADDKLKAKAKATPPTPPKPPKKADGVLKADHTHNGVFYKKGTKVSELGKLNASTVKFLINRGVM